MTWPDAEALAKALARGHGKEHHQPCTGLLLCRVCAAAYLGRSPDWFDDHVRKEIAFIAAAGRWERSALDQWVETQRRWPHRRSSSSKPRQTTVAAAPPMSAAEARQHSAEIKAIMERLSRPRRKRTPLR